MLRKQKKKEKSSICKIPREINTGKIWTQLLPIGHFNFFFVKSVTKKSALIALNFIVVIARTVLKLFGFLAWGIQTPPWSE